MNPRKAGITLLFLVFGGIATFMLAALINYMNGAAAAGDGVTHADHRSVAGYAVPYGIYFLCGTIAGLLDSVGARWKLAVLAHLSLVAGLIYVAVVDRVDNLLFYAGIVVITGVVLGLAWVSLLRRSDIA